jgi:glycogen synthase
MSNEILSNDYKNKLKLQECIELKKALMITLVSMVAENRQQKISDLMMNSIKIDVIFDCLKSVINTSFNKNNYEELLNNKDEYIPINYYDEEDFDEEDFDKDGKYIFNFF